MEIGKVPNDILKHIILNKIKNTREEVLVRPKIGEDCCAIDFGENACVLTSDPITGAVNEVGRLAVNISCNDIASSGVEPIGLLVTILAPAGTTEDDLDLVMTQLCNAAAELNVDIIGGHTEITNAVTRFVINTTAVGKVLKSKMVTTSGAKPGDDVIMTKSAGLEGAAIIAHDKGNQLENVLGKELVNRAKEFIHQTSVVKEGVIAGNFGVHSMHDVTEGGILGAVWEVAEASEFGIQIFRDHILVEPETVEICNYYNINPLKLISSGCMIITCTNGPALVKKINDQGIKAAIIGKITTETPKKLVAGNHSEDILQPESDELYKVIL